jgi:hypothetical protein
MDLGQGVGAESFGALRLPKAFAAGAKRVALVA